MSITGRLGMSNLEGLEDPFSIMSKFLSYISANLGAGMTGRHFELGSFSAIADEPSIWLAVRVSSASTLEVRLKVIVQHDNPTAEPLHR
jgi:hypothetical protein